MTSDVIAKPVITVKNKVGLVLATLLALGDVTSPFTGQDQDSLPADTQGPPMPVLIGGAALGLVTIIAVVLMWRSGSRAAGRVVAGTRILSALLATPAFFAGGVPAPVIALVAVVVVITVVTVALVLSRPKAA